jgi:HAD superfamily hydrolase (TIGR01509 family)
MKFAAIFWDNDGVLMETEHLYYRANAEALAGLGIDLPLDDFCRISLREGASVLRLAGAGEAQLRPWRDRRYLELLAAEARVMTGALELLQRLHGRLPMAIVTSCRRPHFDQMHHRSGLTGFFDFILTREDYLRGKPDPEPYVTACRRAGVEPKDCLAVEDSERGVTSAAAAGLQVAAFPGQLNQGGSFTAARWRIDRLAELAPLIGLEP